MITDSQIFVAMVLTLIAAVLAIRLGQAMYI